MRAIDTNLIVRILTNDHPQQALKARTLIDGERVAVATSVMLETAWVLRSTFAFSQSEIIPALRKFIAHPNVDLVERQLVEHGLDLASQGLDLADALHIAATWDCTSFVTFDKPLQKVARKLATLRVEDP